MSLDKFSKPKKEAQIGVACDEDLVSEWKETKAELKKILRPQNKAPDMSARAREKLKEVIEEAKTAINEYKKKNLILD